jgi:hypothetical protein
MVKKRLLRTGGAGVDQQKPAPLPMGYSPRASARSFGSILYYCEAQIEFRTSTEVTRPMGRYRSFRTLTRLCSQRLRWTMASPDLIEGADSEMSLTLTD